MTIEKNGYKYTLVPIDEFRAKAYEANFMGYSGMALKKVEKIKFEPK